MLIQSTFVRVRCPTATTLRQKNDAADAEAICEAVTRANMRFVATKTLEQQSCLMLHRTRHLFIRQQTAVISAIRAHLAEFGIVAPIGRNGVEQLLDVVADTSNKRLPNIFIRVLHFEPIGRAADKPEPRNAGLCTLTHTLEIDTNR